MNYGDAEDALVAFIHTSATATASAVSWPVSVPVAGVESADECVCGAGSEDAGAAGTLPSSSSSSSFAAAGGDTGSGTESVTVGGSRVLTGNSSRTSWGVEGTATRVDSSGCTSTTAGWEARLDARLGSGAASESKMFSW